MGGVGSVLLHSATISVVGLVLSHIAALLAERTLRDASEVDNNEGKPPAAEGPQKGS